MSLKSSEINNCSWIISAELIPPFCSSSCCQACFPKIVRPIRRSLWKLTLKTILNSPELNCSVFFSLYYLRVSKKMDYFLRNLVRRERRISWFNINPLSFINRNDARWIINKFSPLWFCFCLWSGLQNPSPSVVTLVLQADLQDFLVLLLLFESITNLFDPWKFWPRIECCLHSETKFWFQLRVYHTSNWSWLPARVQFSCFPESILSVVMIHHLLEECIHDKPLHKIVLQCL